MTRVELALILKIIDSHTKFYNPNYLPVGVKENGKIESVPALKEDIIQHYNEVMRNKGEETV